MSNELVSIIVPVYRAEQYLSECVDSLLEQTYPNIEIVLVDDGSPDGSPALCDGYAARDARVTVIHKENGGVSSARNAGLAAAKGEYIIFVDSDDRADGRMVELLYGALVQNQADISIGALQIDGKTESGSAFYVEDAVVTGEREVADWICRAYCRQSICSPVARCYKKSLCPTFKEDMALGEDTLFNIEYFEKVHTVALMSNVLYHYRIIEGSDSLAGRFFPVYFEHFKRLYEATLKMLNQKGFGDPNRAELVHYRFAYYSLSFMMRHARTHEKKEALAYIRKLCSDSLLRQAVRLSRGKHGLRFAVGKLLVRIKGGRLLYLLARRGAKKRT